MDEIVYNLLLKSTLGLTLPGTLRYRFTDVEAASKATGGYASSLLTEALERPTMELFVFQVEGTISIPLLTGLQPVPISGISLFSLLGPPLTTWMNNASPARGVSLQFNAIDADHLGGGLGWQPGVGELLFSVLGTRQGAGV